LTLWEWKNSVTWDKIFLTLFNRILRAFPQIDLTEHQDRFFACFLKSIKSEFPHKEWSHVENFMQVNAKQLIFLPKGNCIQPIAEMAVHLMRPKTHQSHERFW